MVRVSDLKPHPRNYVEHPRDQIEHLKARLRKHRFYRNIVIARDDMILAGHGIVTAAVELGIEEVPAHRKDMDPFSPEALELLAGDNEVQRLRLVDDRKLTVILREVKEKDPQGLAGTGFDEQRLANLTYVTRPRSEVAGHNEAAHWVGLPDYEPATDPLKLTVSFENEQDRAAFLEKLDVTLPGKGRYMWWPPKPRDDRVSLLFDG